MGGVGKVLQAAQKLPKKQAGIIQSGKPAPVLAKPVQGTPVPPPQPLQQGPVAEQPQQTIEPPKPAPIQVKPMPAPRPQPAQEPIYKTQPYKPGKPNPDTMRILIKQLGQLLASRQK